MLIDYSLRII